jgi:hypothetical protein
MGRVTDGLRSWIVPRLADSWGMSHHQRLGNLVNFRLLNSYSKVGLLAATYARYDTGYAIAGGARSSALHIFELHSQLYKEFKKNARSYFGISSSSLGNCCQKIL